MSRKVDEGSLRKSNLRFPVEVRTQRLCLTLSYGPACSSGLRLPHDAVAHGAVPCGVLASDLILQPTQSEHVGRASRFQASVHAYFSLK